MSEQRRDQIQQLHSAYKAALAELDWSVDDGGHSADTIQQARELRIALHAEISDVMRRTSGSERAEPDTCPFSGKSMPTRSKHEGDTFSL
jgi:hypothetical protein